MWKDIRRVAEGELYAKQGEMDGVAKMYSFEDVHIGDEVDGTTLGRRGLGAEGVAADLRKKIPDILASQEYIDEFFDRTPGLPASSREEICVWLEPLEPNSAGASVCPRVHCRLLLATFGYPLTYFGSLSELMQVFIDAVEGIPICLLFELGCSYYHPYIQATEILAIAAICIVTLVAGIL